MMIRDAKGGVKKRMVKLLFFVLLSVFAVAAGVYAATNKSTVDTDWSVVTGKSSDIVKGAELTLGLSQLVSITHSSYNDFYASGKAWNDGNIVLKGVGDDDTSGYLKLLAAPNPAYESTGVDGAFDSADPSTYPAEVTGTAPNLTITARAGTFNFTSFILRAGHTMTVKGSNFLQILSSNSVFIEAGAALRADGGNSTFGTSTQTNIIGAAGGGGGQSGVIGALNGYGKGKGGSGGVESASFWIDIAGGGGGGFGGSGGSGGLAINGGVSYGADFGTGNPPALYAGSSGGGGMGGPYSYPSGSSGGLIRLVGSSISNAGTISASGGDASIRYAGGGSGGGILLQSPGVITNSGALIAHGGNGGRDRSYRGKNGGGGGGGGGRIAIFSGSFITTDLATGKQGTNNTAGGIFTTCDSFHCTAPAANGSAGSYTHVPYSPPGSKYVSSGVYSSAIIDTGISSILSSGTINWTDNATPAINMEIKSSIYANMAGASWCSITKGASLAGCTTDGDRYIQYRATLSTAISSQSPQLKDVTITYKHYPVKEVIADSFTTFLANFNRTVRPEASNGTLTAAKTGDVTLSKLNDGKFSTEAVFVDRGINLTGGINSSFENGTVNALPVKWAASQAAVVKSSEQALYGEYSIKISDNGSSSGMATSDPVNLSSAGTSLILSFFAKTAGGTPTADADLSCSGGAASIGTSSITTSWQRFYTVINTGSWGAAKSSCVVTLKVTSATGVVYFDGLQVEDSTASAPSVYAGSSGADKLSYAATGVLPTGSTNAGTIEFFFKPEWNGNDGVEHVFFDMQADDTLSTRNHLIIRKNTSNQLEFYLGDSGVYSSEQIVYDVSSAVTAGNWYHLAATWDGSTSVELYFNGVSVGKSITTGGTGYLGAVDTSFYLGSNKIGTNQADAAIDGFRISSKVRDIYDVETSYTGDRFLVSKTIDTTSNGTTIGNIVWNDTNPSATAAKIQLRTSTDNVNWADFLGPASTTDYYTTKADNSTKINASHKDFSQDRYVQYKVFLSSDDGQSTPSFEDITIEYTVPEKVVVTSGNVSLLSTGTGTGGVYKVGDKIKIQWDDSVQGDNNTANGAVLKNSAPVSFNFSEFGGVTVTAVDNGTGADLFSGDNKYTASYTLAPGNVDQTGFGVNVRVDNNYGDSTILPYTVNISVDNKAPVITALNIAILSTGSGTPGAAYYKIGDLLTVQWDNSPSGDNNSDLASLNPITVDFSKFGGGNTVVVNDDGTGGDITFNDLKYAAQITIAEGTIIDTSGLLAAITVTDDAGNVTTVVDDKALAVDTIKPNITDGNISVTSTAGGLGSTYKIGDTVTVEWDYSNDAEVDILASAKADFSAFGGPAGKLMSDTGSVYMASYTIIAGNIDASSVRVSVAAVDDMGNQRSVTDSLSMKLDNILPVVTNPNIRFTSTGSGTGGGYVIGDTATVLWDSSAAGDNNSDISRATVDFSKLGGGAAAAMTNVSGIYTANYVIAAGTVGLNLNVTVTAVDDAGQTTSTSDSSNISILGIKLSSPASTPTWYAGSTGNINWSRTGAGDPVYICYSPDGGTTYTILNSGTAVNRSSNGWTWNIPSTTILSNNSKIKIVDSTIAAKCSGTALVDSKPVRVAGVITVTSPNGGDSFAVGSTDKTITWTSSADITKVNIDYYDGSSWLPLVSGCAVTTGQACAGNSFSWNPIPDKITKLAKVRVTDAVKGHVVVNDISDSAFNITGNIMLVSPNGGESWAVGETKTISWTTQGTLATVHLQYATETDNYTNWTTFALNCSMASGGSCAYDNTSSAYKYPWKVNDILTTLGRNQDLDSPFDPDVLIKVRVKDADTTHPTAYDDTDSTLTAKYYKVKWKIQDMNKTLLSKLDVSEAAADLKSAWTISTSTFSGGTERYYPYNANSDYTTKFSKTENGVTYDGSKIGWQAKPVAGTCLPGSNIDLCLTVTMETAATAAVSVSVNIDPSYDEQNDAIDINSWITKKGQLKSDYDTGDGITVKVMSSAGKTLQSGLGTSATRSSGVFSGITYDPSAGLTPDEVYTIMASVTYLGNVYDGVTTFSIPAVGTYDVKIETSYNSKNDSLISNIWLTRSGVAISDPGNLIFKIFDDSATASYTMTVTGSAAKSGVFSNIEWDPAAGLNTNKLYNVSASVLYRNNTYTANKSFSMSDALDAGTLETKLAANNMVVATSVASELNTGGFKDNVADAVSNKMGGSISGQTSTLKSYIDSKTTTLASINSNVLSILEDTGTTIPDKIKAISGSDNSTSTVSKLMNSETSIKTGGTISIKYQTSAQLSPVIDVFKPDGTKVVSDGAMSAMSGENEIYEYSLMVDTNWGTGDFTITTSNGLGNMDSMVLTVNSTDFASVAASIEGMEATVNSINNNTISLSNVNDMNSKIDSLIGTIDSMEKANKDYEGGNAANQGEGDTTALYDSLVQISNSLKESNTKNAEMLNNMFELSGENADNIDYIKNKTLELKAIMKLNQNLIDSVANKPTIETWFERE